MPDRAGIILREFTLKSCPPPVLLSYETEGTQLAGRSSAAVSKTFVRNGPATFWSVPRVLVGYLHRLALDRCGAPALYSPLSS